MNEMTVYQERTDDFLAPVVQVQRALVAYQSKKDFIDQVLKKDVDFGEIPGTNKPTLLKPGAEKMVNLFGLSPVFEDVKVIEDWTGTEYGEPFFYYRQRCKLHRSGRFVGSAEGSCNSWEKKYRYRWVAEADIPEGMDKSKLATRGGRASEFDFALDKAETTGQYGKPAEYWKRFKDAIAAGTATRTTRKTRSGKSMDAWEIDTTLYQVPNSEIAELVNTVLKMSQKRALIAAVLIVTGVSEFFTQDIEDYVDAVFVDASANPAIHNPVILTTPKAADLGATVAMPEEPPFPDLDKQFGAQPEVESTPAPAQTDKLPPLRCQPETLKARLALTASTTKDRSTPEKKGLVAAVLESCLSHTTDPKASRKQLMVYLIGKDSLKDATDAEIMALYKWLSPSKNEVSGEWIADAMAAREAVAAFNAAQPDQQSLL